MAIVLPTESTKSVQAFDLATTLLYGPPKIGKSTVAASYPRPLFAACEEGLKFLDAYKVGIERWEDFVELSALLRKEKHDFRTLVVDTADILFKYCQDYVCKKKHIEHPADEDWGKGYEAVRDEFQRHIGPLTVPGPGGKTRFGIVFISHAKTVEVKGRVIKTARIVPTFPNGARKIIMPMVDIVGYCGFGIDADGEPTDERRVHFRPSEQVEAGDKTDKLPSSLPMLRKGWYDSARKAFERPAGSVDDGNGKPKTALPSAKTGPKKRA